MRHRGLVPKLGSVVAALCMIAAAQARNRENTSTPPEFAAVVQCVEQAQRNAKPRVPYQVIRQYRLSGSDRSHDSSNVVAQVEYSPPDRETYVIQEHSSSRRGEQVVRQVLDSESAMVAGGPQAWSGALVSRDNYTFTDLGESTLDGKRFYLLGLMPRRKEKDLITGRAWVDKRTFRIRRIEGEMAKSPSWLLKKVHVRLDFSEVSGLWLETAMEATADVRFVGSQTLHAQTLDCRRQTLVADRSNPKPARTIHRGIPAELLFPAGK
jgi:hypothetical protein